MKIAWLTSEAALNGATPEQTELACRKAEEALIEPVAGIVKTHGRAYAIACVHGLETLSHWGAAEHAMAAYSMPQELTDTLISQALEAIMCGLAALGLGHTPSDAEVERFEGHCELLHQHLQDAFALALAMIQLDHPMAASQQEGERVLH